MPKAKLADKFAALETAITDELVERNKETHTAIVALISRRHHFQIGPPGTAKSLLVSRISLRISGLGPEGHFQWLLTRYSTPEELFGPPSLKDLEQGKYKRNMTHKLPHARIAFLDEIFKGNSSILNANLSLMNERVFFDDGLPISVELSSMFAASNEMPQGEELGALWDRLHFRHEVRPVQDSGNFIKMLANPIQANPEPLISWDDLVEAQQAANKVKVPELVLEALKTLRDNLKKEGIEPTERRWVECLSIIRAEAWLHDREIADIDDMRVLRHVMWSRLEDQKIVDRSVLELANPIDKEAHDLLERVIELGEQLTKALDDADNSKAAARQCIEIHTKLGKAHTAMKDLGVRSEAAGRKSDILEELRSKVKAVAENLVKEGFGITIDVPPAT